MARDVRGEPGLLLTTTPTPPITPTPRARCAAEGVEGRLPLGQTPWSSRRLQEPLLHQQSA